MKLYQIIFFVLRAMYIFIEYKYLSQTLDTQHRHNEFPSDGFKEGWCPIDRLQIHRTNLHQTMDQSSERQLKLNPYLILDTDPTLEKVNYSNDLSRFHHSLDTVSENYFCPFCNIHIMNKIEKSQTLDTHQEHNAFTSDGFKEGWCPIDRLQTHQTNLHQTMDHSSERQLKLNPYLILDTDPTLENVNYTNTLSRYPHSLGNKKKYYVTQSMYEIEQNDVLKHHKNSRQWEENENCIDQEELKNIDQYIMDIPSQKTLVNHIQIAMPIELKETLKSLKNIKDTPIVKESSMIRKGDEQILNSNIYKKEKFYDKNSVPLIPKMRRQTFNTNDTSMFPVNSLKTHMNLKSENARKILESPIMLTLNNCIEQNVMTDEPNKLAFDHLFPGTQIQKDNFEYHSALRPSLFCNMPPYIRFSSHDTKGKPFPLSLQNVLKWKLNSITPIVIRQTIQNSGFKFVKSEESLIQNDSSVITKQSNQSVNSLQNDCGVTPPIDDAICGVAPPSNELMMLPRSQSSDWVGTWGRHMKSLCFKTLREQQKLNHFPGTFQIGRKDRLWKNLHRLILKYGTEQFGFVPTSYILPQEVKMLRKVWQTNNKDKWIVKPPASYRGTGIRVISKWDQIPMKVPLVVQRYIDNPYLINDTKFDLRLYILITSINPLRLYLYDNGLVRFASVKYSSDLTTLCDRYMHLTNYSINRLSSQYIENEDADACQGHKWTLRSLWTYMEKERKIDVKKLWESLEDLVVKTVISGESPMSQICHSNLINRYNAYELFGIDVLFDEDLKPWILEVNISPSLHSSSPLDLAVKGPLVKDLMNMVGYHIPNKMSHSTHNTLLKMLGVKSPLCYDKRLYTFNLSAKEKEKQEYFANVESRVEYIDNILDVLLPDDIRHLIVYEDELTQIGSFQKVFPTTSSFKYHQYFDGFRYYNMLFDAWECRYSNNREEGIALLEKLCQLKIHLEVPDSDDEQSKDLQNPQKYKNIN